MTKIDIYSGFLGAGKTTLIKKMIQEGYQGQKLVLIENEFGEIGIDGGFLQDAGINITEMNSGCICCSLVGDFGKALEQVISQYQPDRVIIEPSGVGKLSDVITAVNKVTNDEVTLGYTVAVADASKVKVYRKNFGEFYNNQIETATTILLSRTDSISQEKLDKAVELIRELNSTATVVTTPWSELTGQQLIEAMEGKAVSAAELAQVEEEHHCCGHHHHHDHDHEHEEEHHCCGHHGHHHDHEEEHHCCGHHGHHHHHDHEEGKHHCCGHHGHHHDHHHHDHGEHCGCGHHHHDHHADEVFTSWGVETARKFTMDEIHGALTAMDSGKYGMVLRAKGIVPCTQGGWIHFDYVPGEANVRMGGAEITGKLCVIGAQLDEAGVAALFGV
ncbi:MAG: cobalamin biosynthesis protein CobW [Oscillospiraceae bacterium]|nr:cobalamin biosynthesis protein CobW [Oscillospiraceae bacterium]